MPQAAGALSCGLSLPRVSIPSMPIRHDGETGQATEWMAPMQFLLLLYGDEVADAELPAEQVRAVVEAHGAFGAAMRASGAYRFGAALAESSMATTVTREGDEIVTDGPFAEGREQMGGIYLIECADLDEALSWARQVPESNKLKVEIRPVLDL